MRWIDVAADGSVAPGALVRVRAGESAVVLVGMPDGEIRALEDGCPHAGAPLSEGDLRDGHIVCAWHGWRFDAVTGACPTFRGAPAARCVEVRREAGRILVGVPGD